MATKTAVIVLCDEAVLIFAIPPLSPQPPDFNDRNSTHIPPLFTIPYPDGVIFHSFYYINSRCRTISSWYFGSSQPLYFDMICQDSKLRRFEIMLKPDLSTASLHLVNTSELTRLDFRILFYGDYMICEDTLVSCWYFDGLSNTKAPSGNEQWGVYTGSTSARFSNVTSNGGPASKMLLPDIGDWWCGYKVCPASGRFLLRDIGGHGLIVLDVF